MPDLEKIKIFGQQFPLDMGYVSSYGYFDMTLRDSDYIPDIVQRGLDLLVEQFKNSNDLQDFFFALLANSQLIENSLADLKRLNDIQYSSNDQLDIIGEIVGEDRNFKDDPEYREAILQRILINKSNGEPEVIIQYLRILTKATIISYLEEFPAAIVLTFVSAYPIPEDLQKRIEEISSTGVRIVLQFLNTDELQFAFSSENGLPELPNTSGMSELDYTEGGVTIGGIIVELISD